MTVEDHPHESSYCLEVGRSRRRNIKMPVVTTNQDSNLLCSRALALMKIIITIQ